MNIKKNRLLLVIVTILVFELFLWFNVPVIQPRFLSVRNSLTSIGQILGLFGVVLFAINLILSTRLRFLDKYLDGLNEVYLKHNLIGQIAFIMLLFHPIFLLAKYASNFKEAAAFFSLGNDLAINFGKISLGAMFVLIVLTLYIMPKYNIWKWTHKFFGLAFFFASLHIWLIPSDTSKYLPLKIYVLFFVFLGLLAFVYKTILGSFLVKKYIYRLKEINLINYQISEIILKPEGEKIKFIPGQFVFLNFKNSDIGIESHPFSITSSPDDEEVSFSIKNLGDYTNKIKDLKIGTISEIEGPFGRFSFLNSSDKKQIWIAGGIGITPFVSMAKSLLYNHDYEINLIYCVRNKNEAVYLDLLEEISRRTEGQFKVIAFYSDDNGYLNADLIIKISGTLIDNDIFICAPPVMINSLRKQLISAGVNKKSIHSEEFSL